MKKLILYFPVILLAFTACKDAKTEKIISVSTSLSVEKKAIKPLEEKAYAKLDIEGMTCALGCAATIEKNLNKTSGVASATVDFDSKTAWVIYDAKALSLDEITGIVKATGDAYSVSAIKRVENKKP